MEESKEYVKVKANLSGRFRFLRSADEAPIVYGSIEHCGPLYEDFLRNSGLSDAVSQFLIGMDNKLNSILSILRKDEVDKRLPYEISILEISGGSISFSCEHDLTEGAYIEAMIFLEDFPPRPVGSIGKITDVSVTDLGKVYSMDFTNIADSDQDHIVQYVFQVERRMLRERSKF